MVSADSGTEDLILPVCFTVAKGCSLLAVSAEGVDHVVAEGGCIHHIHRAGAGADGEIAVVSHLQLSRFTFLGGDDDYTVGSTRPVDGSCGSIL